MTKKQKRAKASRSRKRTAKARAAHALMKIMNPAGVKKMFAVRVKRLKGGGVSVTPVTNPGAFAKCVKGVSVRGGVTDPRAVCAMIGRRKYGQAEMTRRSIAGRKRARRGR
jgi:hypothetical protein